jgi:hypothetical protein
VNTELGGDYFIWEKIFQFDIYHIQGTYASLYHVFPGFSYCLEFPSPFFSPTLCSCFFLPSPPFPFFSFFLLSPPHTLASITALYLTPPFRSLSCAATSPASSSGNLSIFGLMPCRTANSSICNIIRRDPWLQGRKASDFSKAGSAGNEISPNATVKGYIVPKEAIKSMYLAYHVRQ